jgi:hypothetical protein
MRIDLQQLRIETHNGCASLTFSSSAPQVFVSLHADADRARELGLVQAPTDPAKAIDAGGDWQWSGQVTAYVEVPPITPSA